MRCLIPTILALMASAAPGMFGQTPTFEAAAIHEVVHPLRVLRGFTISGTRVSLEGYDADWLIAEAFGLKDYQVVASSIPDATRGKYYAIDARVSGSATPTRAGVRLMLQSLLAERFHLTFHRENRSIPVYALVVDKNGPTLKPGTGDADCASLIGPVNPTDRSYRYRFTNCTLDPLVATLQADRPILNQTGLTGRYDILITATPEFKMQNTSEPGDIRFLDAVRQLGLRLNPQNSPVEVVVVEHFDAPTPN